MAKRRPKRRMSKSQAKARVARLKGRGRAPKPEVDSVPKMFVVSFQERIRNWIFIVVFLLMCTLEIGLQWREVTIVPEQIGGYRTLYDIHFYITLLFIATLIIWILPRLSSALVWHDYDRQWIRKLGGFARRFSPVPPAGKYNGGQKLYTLFMLVVGLIYGATGVALHNIRLLDPKIVRACFNLHLGSFILMVFLTIIYVYLMYIATPGRFTILTKGYLTVKFLQIHHPIWFERLKERPRTSEEEHRRLLRRLHEKDLQRAAQLRKEKEQKLEEDEIVDMEPIEEAEEKKAEEAAPEEEGSEVSVKAVKQEEPGDTDSEESAEEVESASESDEVSESKEA